VSLAEQLQGDGHDAVATPGSKGQFDVQADGRLVFSKKQVGRFPETEEVRTALRAGG
jgi:selT/selW/selH-like putative selenoprotein